MRYRKIAAYISCIAALLVTVSLCFAQVRTGEKKRTEPKPWTEEVILGILDHYGRTEQVEGGVDAIYTTLIMAGDTAAVLKSERVIEALANFPVHDPDVGEAKITALRHFKDNHGAHAYVVDALASPDPKIQKKAAGILFRWGESDLAIPIIHKYGNYEDLGVDYDHRDPRAIPVLQEGARTSDWEGRTMAAFLLQFFGDSTTIIEVACDIVANAPNIDDHSIARAKYTALRQLARHMVTNDIPAIARLADDASVLVRIQVVDILELYAYNGIEEAYQALKKIAEENADLNLRGTAKVALDNIDNHRREK